MDDRRKRLLYRATHRGTKEADRIMGAFAKAHVGRLSEDELDCFEVLLDQNDVDLVDWITGLRPVPQLLDGPLLQRMIADLDRH